MAKVINSENSSKAVIKKYQFLKIEESSEDIKVFDKSIFKEPNLDEDREDNQHIKEKKESQENQENSVELLEKIESLTSQIVTLQMELDKNREEFEIKLKKIEEDSFDKGKEEGIKEITQIKESENDELKSQLIRSITTLEEQKSHFDEIFKNLEEDLIESAIVIAKKIIKKEIEKDSSKVAISLASSLINSLKDLTNITIKTNPYDFQKISEHFNQSSIKIEADEAIALGGVIILSDTTNIDATIKTRLDYAINLIGKESI